LALPSAGVSGDLGREPHESVVDSNNAKLA
jgi:hypothetical protein